MSCTPNMYPLLSPFISSIYQVSIILFIILFIIYQVFNMLLFIWSILFPLEHRSMLRFLSHSLFFFCLCDCMFTVLMVDFVHFIFIFSSVSHPPFSFFHFFLAPLSCPCMLASCGIVLPSCPSSSCGCSGFREIAPVGDQTDGGHV